MSGISVLHRHAEWVVCPRVSHGGRCGPLCESVLTEEVDA